MPGNFPTGLNSGTYSRPLQPESGWFFLFWLASNPGLSNPTSVKIELRKKALLLSAFTIAYNLVEGIVSIYFGISEDALSLAGFGGDSLIEVGSALLVVWRFRGESDESVRDLAKERSATRGIGILFGLLSIIAVTAAVFRFISGQGPQSTLAGLVISILSLSFMFYLWKAKQSVARKLDSATMMSDARCSLACIKLSVILLLGSGLFILMPTLWWIDSAAAIGLAIVIGNEGWEMRIASRAKNFTGGCGGTC